MHISQVLHLWVLECILILPVSTSIRITNWLTRGDRLNSKASSANSSGLSSWSSLPRQPIHNALKRGDRLSSKVSPVNMSSLSNLSSLARLPYAHDERQLPKSISVLSQQQMILLCAVIILLLLILVAVALIMYRICVSSAERKAADQVADELAQSFGAEASDIRPDDTVQWMWGDANMMSGLANDAGHSLAQQDPLRWSRWSRLGATIVDLAKYKDVQNVNRPVEIRTRRTKAILYFNSVDEALAALPKHTEAASILPDDTVQWMWGDANVLGHLAPGKGHSLAHRDPLRWSRWSRVGATAVDLAKFKDARSATRPVKIRTRRSMVNLHFDTVDEALSVLRDEALLPQPRSSQLSSN